MSVNFRVEVYPRSHSGDNHSKWVNIAHQSAINSLTGCFVARIFFIGGSITRDDAERIVRELLVDPVTETATIGVADLPADHTIDVSFQPGVTDPAAENLIRTAHMLGVDGLSAAATGYRYFLTGKLSAADLDKLAESVFANTVIHRYCIDDVLEAPFVETAAADNTVETIDLLDADEQQLMEVSQTRRLSLDADEMRAIQTYYRGVERNPTDVELETLAQTWSEHCVHKTFKARINFNDGEKTEQVDGILQAYLRTATEKVNKSWVRSAFVDNAGIIAFDDEYDLAFKVETHNHPSALEPFGGANTGVGGVVRDVLGVSAEPIANTDVLMFGPQELPESDLLDGILHPRRIAEGVIHGVEDYGNKMGIPTVNGAIFYDKSYTANPLVFCGCAGILPRNSHRTSPQDGDLIVVLGGRTGRDGLRGATFSSMEMDTTTSDIASVSVQIGHPINEKKVQEVVVRARDEGLYNAITDCGAGGLSSAVGEMGEKLGADVELNRVPLKYTGLRPWEIWLSEAQERMVMAVPPENWERLQQIATGQNVEVVEIGTYRTTGKLHLEYNGQQVGELSMDFLHNGIPRREMSAVWQPPEVTSEATPPEVNAGDALLKLLSHPNIASKESTIRLYDHEVQGGTIVKPLTGVNQQGHNNASVIVPIQTRHRTGPDGSVRGFALSVGINPYYGETDPYAMAWAAIDEAFRNLVAVGADPDQIALLDNFCWGNPALPDRLGSLVLAARGCHDAALAYQAPFVSGKDSLNNEYADADGNRHPIMGTLLISGIGIVPDVNDTVTPDLKHAGNRLFVIGETRDELGGSHFGRINEHPTGTVPQPQPEALLTMRAVHRAIRAGHVQSCHDISEGGLAVALAEMAIGGNLGVSVTDNDLRHVHTQPHVALFSETTGRFVVEVAPEHIDAFLDAMSDVTVIEIGSVLADQSVAIGDIELTLSTLRAAWRGDVVRTEHRISSTQTTQPRLATDRYQTVQMHRTSSRTGERRVIILHADGTNRDRDAALAVELAGGTPEIVHRNQLISGERRLLDYHMLLIPGGFSYGDDLGAGQVWAQDLRHYLHKDLQAFVVEGRPVLGICNGFQVLVKSGLLPDADFASGDERRVTLTYNAGDRFECRWVYLTPNFNSTSMFIQGLRERIYCPVAHGEGRLIVRSEDTYNRLWRSGQIALTYTDEHGETAGYPSNPNGSHGGIAALSSGQGNVMGLMPHPENHIFPWQHPRWHRGERGNLGLELFKNGLRFA